MEEVEKLEEKKEMETGVEVFMEKLREKLNLTDAWKVKDAIRSPNGVYIKHMEYCHSGRIPWAAEIVGADPKYKFARKFLTRTKIEDKTYQLLPWGDMPAVVEFHGGSTNHEYRSFYYIYADGDNVMAIGLSEKEILEALAEAEKK